MEGVRSHVLAVDDMADAADSQAELLTMWGYDAEACHDGASALAAARVRRPDAVLLDVGMPGMDGFDFAARLRALPGCGGTVVIVISGHTAESYRARGRELGIGHYLFKPADPHMVRALLAHLVVPVEPTRSLDTPRRVRVRPVRRYAGVT